MQRAFVTGGAGFIGSHLVDALLARDCAVMAFDCLDPQAHPNSPTWPTYRTSSPGGAGDDWSWQDQEGLECWFGDVRDGSAVIEALLQHRPDTVFHLAAKVGVGQSNTKIANYVSANVTGTAILMDVIVRYNALVDERAEVVREWEALSALPEDEIVCEEGESREEAAERVQRILVEWSARIKALPTEKIKRVFIAGSMSAYGEGGSQPAPFLPARVVEHRVLDPQNVYAWTKAAQEQIALVVGKVHGIDVVVGRFFNVYGPRQELSNPYTGVVAHFAARCLAGLAPRVYEDGEQERDLIHVDDLVSGILTIVSSGEPGGVYNVGTGLTTELKIVAEIVSETLAGPAPEITGEYRKGDVRSCVADPSKLRRLGWRPVIDLKDGLSAYLEWATNEPGVDPEHLEAAHEEQVEAGLLAAGGDR